MNPLEEKAIVFEFGIPSGELITFLKQNLNAVKIENQKRIQIENRYFKDGISGTSSEMRLRSAVWQKVLMALKHMPEDYGYIIFDAYRSRETQAGLFRNYFTLLKGKFPEMSEEELNQETRKFVAHPDEPSRLKVPPHNSGGAIDIGLSFKGKVAQMGTDFDDLSELAATDVFEKAYDPQFNFSKDEWEMIRKNRRILFHSLCAVGFTNWKYEWWHFDLGNSLWAKLLGIDEIYGSMDELCKLG